MYINLIVLPDLYCLLLPHTTKKSLIFFSYSSTSYLGPYTVKDSFSFGHVDSDCGMASFDVNSLFTDVPLADCVNLCCYLILKDSYLISYNEFKLTSDQFCKLLNVAIKDRLYF